MRGRNQCDGVDMFFVPPLPPRFPAVSNGGRRVDTTRDFALKMGKKKNESGSATNSQTAQSGREEGGNSGKWML